MHTIITFNTHKKWQNNNRPNNNKRKRKKKQQHHRALTLSPNSLPATVHYIIDSEHATCFHN